METKITPNDDRSNTLNSNNISRYKTLCNQFVQLSDHVSAKLGSIQNEPDAIQTAICAKMRPKLDKLKTILDELEAIAERTSILCRA
jgi:O-glycosyl hydrolase